MEAAVAEVSFASSDLPRLEGQPLAASAPEAALEAAADHAGADLSLAPESLLPVPPAEEDNDSCGDEPVIPSEALQAVQRAAECPEGVEEELPEAEAAPAAAAAEPLEAAAEPVEPAEPLEAAAEPVEPAGPLPARELGLKKTEPMDWFKLRLDKNAHRFQVEMDKNKTRVSEFWDDKHKQMFFSRSFKTRMSWQDALSEIHAWMWEKATSAGLETQEVQVPGEVPAEVLNGLKAEMDNLPAPKDYSGRK